MTSNNGVMARRNNAASVVIDYKIYGTNFGHTPLVLCPTSFAPENGNSFSPIEAYYIAKIVSESFST